MLTEKNLVLIIAKTTTGCRDMIRVLASSNTSIKSHGNDDSNEINALIYVLEIDVEELHM
jgi:hypothetical protein